MSNSLDIDVAACRKRQQRLLAVMERAGVDLAIVTQTEHVQYFAGPRFAWTFSPAAALTSSGRMILVAPNDPPPVAAADRIATYPAQLLCTLRNDQRQASSQALLAAIREELPAAPKRIGVEYSSFGRHLSQAWGGENAVEHVDLEPAIYSLRRIKDPDELARLRHAIAATGKMYARAREMIRPGIAELDVFNELQGVAVAACGEPLTGTGNDYRCAAPGGAPRAGAVAQAGELYILDLGPAFRGYFADNCRTIAVSEVSPLQQQAWERVARVFDLVRERVRPGVSCRQLFLDVQSMLASAPCGKFFHHLGHGIGLFPHEAPHLNSEWDDTFQAGEVFTVEPGLYAEELRAGLRLENDYLVTETGVELLSNFPLGLKTD